MKKLFLAMVFVLVASLTGFAQQTFEWKAYGLEVTLPAGMKVLQNDEELFMVGNDNSKLEIHPMDEDLDSISEEDVLEVVKTIGNNLGVDLSQSETKELSCQNGGGFYMVALHKTHKNLYGIISFAGSETSQISVCVAGLVTEADAEKAGFILGSFNFKK
jgi:hypothetical protein